MKLFTHNLLTSKMLRGVQVGFPLKINASEVKVTRSDFYAPITLKMLSKVDWSALLGAVESIGHAESAGLPPTIVEDFERNDDFLRKAHHAFFEIEVISGELECPETGRKFPITNGVPNMLVNEDEI